MSVPGSARQPSGRSVRSAPQPGADRSSSAGEQPQRRAAEPLDPQSETRTVALPSPVLVASAPAEIGSAVLPTRQLSLQPTRSEVLEFNGMRRVVIGNPAVVDIAVISGSELVVHPKSVGETTLLVWDEQGRHTFQVGVASPVTPAPIEPAPAATAAQIEAALGDPAIRVRAVGKTIFLEGQVADAAAAQRAEAIAQALSSSIKNLIQVAAPPSPPPATPASGPAVEILNQALANTRVTARVVSPTTVLLEGKVTPLEAERIRAITKSAAPGVSVIDALQVAVPAPRQVLIRARVVDINRARLRDVGVNWGALSQRRDGQNTTTTFIEQPFLFGLLGQPFSGNLKAQNTLPFGAQLNLLVQQNAARILSEPNLLVLEGSEGSILVGGEFPFPVVQGGSFSNAVTVEFREFGVRLRVNPVQVAETGEITLKVQPEVSLLDFANAVQVSGFTLPALRTRREDSTVRIPTGQTLAIGGLIENNYSQTARGIPLLSKVPVLGELFKSKSFQRNETELVILITPEVIPEGGSTAATPLGEDAASLPIKSPELPETIQPQPGGKESTEKKRRR